MCRWILPSTLAISISALAAAADYSASADIQVVSARPDGVDLRFAPAGWHLDTLSNGLLRTSFDGAQAGERPGDGAVMRSVMVAVPPSGDITVTAAAESWQPVSTHALASTAASGSPAPLMQWDGPFMVRDIRAVRIWLSPVQSGPRGTSVARRVDVQVRWTAAAARTTAPSDPGFDPIYRTIFANYDQARTFAARAARAPIANPFDSASIWYKVVVQADGPHVISHSQLAASGFPVSVFDPRQYRLFTAGGAALPVPNTTPRPTFHEVPLEVIGGSDGSFDPGDAIYFYGQAPSRWETGSTVSFVHNPYTRDHVYWLTPQGTWTASPQRITGQSQLPGAGAVQQTGIGRVHSEQNHDVNHDAEEFYTWFWLRTDTMSTLVNLPEALDGPGTVAVTSNPLFSPGNARITVNGQTGAWLGSSGFSSTYAVTTWRPTTSIGIRYVLSGQAWIDRLDFAYPRSLDARAAGMEFWLDGSTSDRVQLSGIPSGGMLWDITQPDAPFAITGQLAGATLEFNPGTITTSRRYRIWRRVDAFTPTQIVRAEPGGLRAQPVAADMVVITHSQFAPALADYTAWRESQSGISVAVATVDQIYDDFGFGMFDPVAIRDFLKYTFETSAQPPSAVLLVGDGSYDFLNHSGAGTPNWVPPFIVPHTIDRTAGDQNYVAFGALGTLDSDTSFIQVGDRGWDMMVARWPVRSISELRTVALKISAYESEPEFGLWRNRIVLVADDEFGERGSNSEYIHTIQAESIADSQLTADYTVHKIYMFEYPQDASQEKPGVREEILRSWNEGMLLIDYIGHGSPNVWAHERVLRRSEDIPRMFNGKRLPLVYTASCSIGFFDDPLDQGMGEVLFRRAEGGAIGIISATRLVFSQQNVDLNRAVLNSLLGPANLSIGQALFAGLVARQYRSGGGPSPIENDRKHIYFGDPFMHLARPIHRVRIDNPTAADSLVALKPTHVIGEVQDQSGTPVDVGGEVLLRVLDAPRQRPYHLDADKTAMYELPGRTMFNGVFSSTGSAFDLAFIVPKDISYGAGNARAIVYARGAAADALGIRADLPLATTGDTTGDVTGPAWQLTINDMTPAGRWPVGTDDVWKARLTDPLGINLGGEGHGITATIDGDNYGRTDMTGDFVYDLGSIQTGTVTFTLPELVPGDHDVRLMAWDNANNPSTLTLAITATGETDYAVRNLLVYPNPFDAAAGTPARLTYDLTFAPDRVELSIFTVTGKRVRHISDPLAGPGFNFDAMWDGLDDTGDPVATGVYIVAVEAQAPGRTVKEFAKIVLVRSQ